jgi:hypothetical protein
VPLVLLQHLRGNLDNRDPALIEALASSLRVAASGNAGVGRSSGTAPDTIEQMTRDAIAFLAAMGFPQADRTSPMGHQLGNLCLLTADSAKSGAAA